MNLNFSEVAKELNITPQGARKRIFKYKDNEELKKFLVYENGQLVGLDQDGIDTLRNVGQHRRSFSSDRKIIELEHKLDILEIENKHLKELFEQQKQFTDDYKERLLKSEAEINEFVSGSWIKRITFKKK